MTTSTTGGNRSLRVRSVLALRDFRLFWIGETTSALGSSVTSVALPLVAVVTLRVSPLQVGALSAAAWVPWLVIGLPVGAWVDRLPGRPVMLCADLGSLILFASIPVAAWVDALTIGQLLGVALLGGACRVLFETAYQVYFPSLVSPEQLAPANSLVQGSRSATSVAGSGIAGGMATLFGATSGVLLDSFSFAVSAICLRAIEGAEPLVAPAATRSSLRHDITTGVLFVARDDYLRSFAVFGALTNFGLIGYQTLAVLFLVRDIGISTGLVGILLAAISVGGVIGAAVAGPIGQRFGTARGLMLCLLLGCPAALLIPLTQPRLGLALFVGGNLILVAAIGASNVLQSAWHPRYCPREIYGRITSAGALLNYGTIPLGTLTAGALGNTLGIHTGLWIMTTILAVGPAALIAGPIRGHINLPEMAGA